MSEDAELQAKIAALAQRIERQKRSHTQGAHRTTTPSQERWSTYTRPSHSARGSYGAHRGRGVHKPAFQNRTLVINNKIPAAKLSATVPEGYTSGSSAVLEGGVTTRDRGRMQWTNAAVFDKKAQEKKDAIEETAQIKRQAKVDAQKQRVLQHVYGSRGPSPAPIPQDAPPRELIINDLRFRLATDGSKLIRVFDGINAEPQSTPKETKVAGVTFVRTKKGNMIRQGLLKTKKCASLPIVSAHSKASNAFRSIPAGVPRKLCPDFTTTGSCLRGNRCRYSHDINKLAICKEYLRRGECTAGEDCNLSHDPTSHRVPTCTHFLRNTCTKPNCLYSHIRVDPSAPVCNDFGRLGYCEKGASCSERHVSECPDYTNTGVCRNKKCRLPHVDRAGTLRKAASAKAGKEAEADISSGEEDYDGIDSDDADSEDIEDDFIMDDAEKSGHDLSQQQDFVSF